jgi:phosphohistidine phosphatase
MLRLMLLRHAKSDWGDPALGDHARPLNERGRSAAALMGHYLAAHDLSPDLVLCSTATRARQTWDIVSTAFTDLPATRLLEGLYMASPADLIGIIRQAPADARRLLVVSHNPGLEDLADWLVAAGDIVARQDLEEKFPTAGLAVIDFAVADWAHIHPQGGRLDRFVTPRAIEAPTA